MPDEAEDEVEDDSEMPWESEARQAIENATSEVEHDEVRGVIYLPSGVDHHYDSTREGFTSAEDVRQRLTEIGESEWIAYAPFDGGEPVFEPDVEDIVDNIMERHDVEAFFERVARPDEGDELTVARELTAPGAGLVIAAEVSEINEELVRYLARHPDKMHELNSRTFEQLVAELFKDMGYDVELTPKSKDGGFDIRAFRRNNVGTLLTLIECKRYAATRPVEVGIVRGLYGVSVNEGATNGIIATTSYFTKGAKSFQADNKYKLHLADYDNVKLWLTRYRTPA